MRSLLAWAFVALCGTAAAASGGGTIANVPPSGLSFVPSASTLSNAQATQVTYSYTVKDANGEADFAGIRICSSFPGFGSAAAASDCAPGAVRQAEWTFPQGTSGCPAPPPNWSCVDATPSDGVLAFTYAFTWPAQAPTGSYTETPYARDETPYVAGPAVVTQVTTPGVSFNANVYRWNGTLDTNNWGNWASSPSATNVPSLNFLKGENPGTNPGTISIKYTSTEFSGPQAAVVSISTGNGAKPSNANNLRYCSFTSTLSQVPESGDASHSYANFATCGTSGPADGAISLNIPAQSRVWVMYWVLAMPATLPDGTYTAAYSAT
ncbi:MAG: hypothetical protein ACYDBQ_11950 [Thermoplasmatota archaeon]